MKPKDVARHSGVPLIRIGAVLVLVGSFALVISCGRPPKEKDLLAKFYGNRNVYEALRDMLTADRQVRAVYRQSGVETMNSGLPRNPSDVNFSSDRYNDYRKLLEKIGSTEVFRAGDDNSKICVVVWASGFGGDTRHVNTCWLGESPLNQVASLEEFYKMPKPRHPVFRHIDGNWYLWADW